MSSNTKYDSCSPCMAPTSHTAEKKNTELQHCFTATTERQKLLEFLVNSSFCLF